MARVLKVLMLFLSLGGIATAQDYPIQPVPFTAVKVNDSFWAPRIKKNHEVTIPIALDQCYKTGRVDNFLKAAHQKPGPFGTEYPFDDSDIYKIIEGASYSLQTYADPKLEAQIDVLIDYIGKAQEPDGYLYTARTIDPEHLHPWIGKNRWEKDPELSHELYNLGHLYEAAVAHFLATGKKTLLNIAVKSADLLLKDFGPGKLAYYPGHQVVEMGLVKLYRVTGKKEYLDLAHYFLEIRHDGKEYNQAHQPVAKQTAAVGHAVRATYMYSGMADVAALLGEQSYIQALDGIWDDLLKSKIYLTGGIGATAGNEGFSNPYELPNLTAYNETCASIGSIFWNYRQFLLHGDSKYFDVLEQTLYNGMISGVSLSGDHFFYPNPLESAGKYQRSIWFGCACCPSNVCRFIPSIPGYIYAVSSQRLYVNLFIQSKANMQISGQALELIQRTNYPWDDRVILEINPLQPMADFEIAFRVPGWVKTHPLPGNLYSFADGQDQKIRLQINGRDSVFQLQNGYALINRKWKKGDRVEYFLPMPIRRVTANQQVAADSGRMALQRGPIVYCAEWPDYPDQHVLNLLMDPTQSYTSSYKPELLGGVQVIKGRAKAVRQGEDGKQQETEVPLFLIPYYAWANRGPGEMSVWLATRPEVVLPLTPAGFSHLADEKK
jgi:uncharacterized protein